MNVNYDKKGPCIKEEEFQGVKDQIFSHSEDAGRLAVNYGFFNSPPNQQPRQVVSILKYVPGKKRILNVELDLEGNIINADSFDVPETKTINLVTDSGFSTYAQYVYNEDGDFGYESGFVILKGPTTQVGQPLVYEMFERKNNTIKRSDKFKVTDEKTIIKTLDSLIASCKKVFDMLKINEKIEVVTNTNRFAKDIDSLLETTERK